MGFQGVNLSVGQYFLIVVPIAAALFSWIGAVYWASTHPNVRHIRPVGNRSVMGGMFRAGGGGRAVGPRRDSEPAESTTATGAAEEHVPAEGAEQQAPQAEPARQGAAQGEPGRGQRSS